MKGCEMVIDDTSNSTSIKSLLILEAMASDENTEYFGIHDICRLTGLNQSTVYRILIQMVDHGFVDKLESIKKYRIGIGSVVFASRLMKSNNLVTAARSEMLALNRLTSETVHLLSITGNEVIYINKIDAHHSVGLLSTVGKRNPIHCTSGGKAIAAYLGEEWLEKYFATTGLKQYTAHTITTEAEFRAELESIRQKGYALDRSEHHENIVCVGAPVFDYTGKAIASISVAAPSYRFSVELAESLAKNVVESARNISRQLGADV